MSDIIRLLPDSVANQIAAGEVIESPASVVKELVENAVDAGATRISIIIRDAGRTLIQVVDNGKGMTETDARMAFERHATSKIEKSADLYALHTMGFRGEALPSICAVSQVELHTAVPGAPMGTLIRIAGSKVEAHEPCVCSAGSNFMVKNLFFNVPARRKFLRADSVELSHLMREFERLALVNNNIHLSIDTGTRKIDLRPGTFKQRIAGIWKSNLNMQLLPVEVNTSLVKISGFISRPEHARRRNALKYLIVNGRNMHHLLFQRAIESCYDRLIPHDSQPCYFLKFEVEPDTIDVNVHPKKNKIKFENESEIRTILVAAVKEALGKFSAVPSIDFDTEPIPVQPPRNGDFITAPQSITDEAYNPFRSSASSMSAGYTPGTSGISERRNTGISDRDFLSRSNLSNWESLYENFTDSTKPSESIRTSETEDPSLPGMDREEEVPLCIQFALKYVITTSSEGMIAIDQHRAHVKILYHRYLDQLRRGMPTSQKVMFPEEFLIDPHQRPALDEAMPRLHRLGFELEEIAADRWIVTAVPALANECNPREALLSILDSLDPESESPVVAEPDAEIERSMALALARSAAIRRGQRLSETEMGKLLGDLFSLPDPQYTPSGKRIYVVLNEIQLQSLFG